LPLWLVPGIDRNDEPDVETKKKRMAGEPLSMLLPDQFMKIAPQVFLLPAQPIRTALFCGAAGGVGCTSVCLRTAQALARITTESICLVDANFRAPSLHTVLRLDRAPGFSDFLTQSGLARSFATLVNRKNLWLLPTGNRIANTESLFAAATFRARLAQVATEFRFVLIDSGAGRESAQFAQAASGAILVIDSDTTRREEAHRMKRMLQSVRLPLLGVVVNRGNWKLF
jgi:succinoglycan biosynthesis transport protein ExoP